MVVSGIFDTDFGTASHYSSMVSIPSLFFYFRRMHLLLCIARFEDGGNRDFFFTLPKLTRTEQELISFCRLLSALLCFSLNLTLT